jgi:hypothetical protein
VVALRRQEAHAGHHQGGADVAPSLSDWPLAAGRERIALNHEFSEARLDPEGDSFHGIIRYRATTAPSRAAAA